MRARGWMPLSVTADWAKLSCRRRCMPAKCSTEASVMRLLCAKLSAVRPRRSRSWFTPASVTCPPQSSSV